MGDLGLAVDILINNVGFGTYCRFEDMDPEREQEEIMLNTAALVDLTHHFLPGMLEGKDGIVVNVASMAAFAPIQLFTALPKHSCYLSPKRYGRKPADAVSVYLPCARVRRIQVFRGCRQPGHGGGQRDVHPGERCSSRISWNR